MTSLTDLNGNVITFSYGQYGISQITDTVGRAVTFTYSFDTLMSISDGVRTISYSYSGGKLTAVTDPIGRVTTYEYMFPFSGIQNRTVLVSQDLRVTVLWYGLLM
ncbi:MAG: hypothetical protein WBA22_12495 [Candidatus Methanofastidiosia archaeon]